MHRTAGRTVAAGIMLLLVPVRTSAQDGALDPTFDPGPGASWSVLDILVQPDERIMVGGWFATFNGAGNPYLVRLDPDGTVDATFSTGLGPNSFVTSLAQRPDGRTVIGGNLTQYDGTPCPFLVQLLPDGDLDLVMGGWNIEFVEAVRLRPDGRVVVVGDITPGFITQLDTNGAVDPSFDPGPGANELLRDALILPNGQVLIAGMLWSYDGYPALGIARINADGTFDGTFNATGGPDGFVDLMALQPDGRILIAGGFATYDGVQVNGLCRILPDGSLDATFTSGITSGGVLKMLVQPDGRIVIGGTFTEYAGVPRNRIARLEPDGSLDLSFDPGAGADGPVAALALQPDGRLLIGGYFTSYDGVPRARIARLSNSIPLSSGTIAQQADRPHAWLGTVHVPSGWEGPAQVVVMDHAGRLIREQRAVLPAGPGAIDTSGLAAGAYLVRIEQLGRHLVGRLFIQ